MSAVRSDRFGFGWRRELAPGILLNLDRIDVVEVIADDWLDASATRRRALRTLAAQVPVTLHSVSLGLASTTPVPERAMVKLARLIEFVRPTWWSEHLAFVRGGGIEIGHLAAPPRCAATIDGAVENLARVARVVGLQPRVENVATLVEPPGSDCDEPAWIAAILTAANGGLLLDLHNLYANALNFGGDPLAMLERLPLDRVAAVHLAGGRWIGRPGSRRLLDDHLHAVPDAVLDLLEALAAQTRGPLDVIIERDGEYPPIADLLAELDRVRAAVARGRAGAIKPLEGKQATTQN